MNKKTIITIMALMIIILLIGSCSLRRHQGINYNYRTGNSGLTLNIVEDLPPKTVVEDSKIPVVLKIKNEGAEDVPYNDVMINLLFDTTYLEGKNRIVLTAEDKKDAVFHGKNISYPDGEEKIIGSEPLTVKRIIGTRELPSTSITATICYKYRTVMSSEICIDNNKFFQNKREQVCRYSDIVPKSQGAPVAVTKIEMTPSVVSMGGGNIVVPEFKIYIKNTGRGTIMAPATKNIEDACLSRNLAQEDIGAVNVKAEIISAELECEPNPLNVEYLFAGKEAYVRCKVKEQDINNPIFRTPQNYLSHISVELEYYYKDKDKRDIEIERRVDTGFENIPEETSPYYIKGVPACKYYAEHGGMGNINKSYDCSCGEEECFELSKEGKCYFGLCPGGYCCDTTAKKG